MYKGNIVLYVCTYYIHVQKYEGYPSYQNDRCGLDWAPCNPKFGWHYLSNAASFALCTFHRVKDHHNLPHSSPVLKKTRVRQVVLDKWSPPPDYVMRFCIVWNHRGIRIRDKATRNNPRPDDPQMVHVLWLTCERHARARRSASAAYARCTANFYEQFPDHPNP